MNTYIIKEYGHDDTGHHYIVSHTDNIDEVYEGDYHDSDINTVCRDDNINIIHSRQDMLQIRATGNRQ